MKRLALILGGLCGFLCAVGFSLFLVKYIAGGTSSQVFGLPMPFFGEPVSSGSILILIGLVHVLGLAMSAFLCFTVGAVLCAHGIVPNEPTAETDARRPSAIKSVEPV